MSSLPRIVLAIVVAAAVGTATAGLSREAPPKPGQAPTARQFRSGL